MLNLKVLIFDFDGTIADTFEDIYSCWHKTCIELKLKPISREIVKSAIGPARDEYLKILFGNKSKTIGDLALSTYRGYYNKHCTDQTRLYNGVEETIKDLSGKYFIAIASNKPSDQVSRIIVRLGLKELFGFIIGPSKNIQGKPCPDMLLECSKKFQVPAGSCAIIGDTDLDVLAGKAADMVTVGVSWGFFGDTKVISAGPDFIIDHARQLKNLV